MSETPLVVLIVTYFMVQKCRSYPDFQNFQT